MQAGTYHDVNHSNKRFTFEVLPTSSSMELGLYLLTHSTFICDFCFVFLLDVAVPVIVFVIPV